MKNCRENEKLSVRLKFGLFESRQRRDEFPNFSMRNFESAVFHACLPKPRRRQGCTFLGSSFVQAKEER